MAATNGLGMAFFIYCVYINIILFYRSGGNPSRSIRSPEWIFMV